MPDDTPRGSVPMKELYSPLVSVAATALKNSAYCMLGSQRYTTSGLHPWPHVVAAQMTRWHGSH